MGMNALARKIKLSLLLSSLPPFSPSLQTDDRSKLPQFAPLFFLHPSSLNHFLLSYIFIQQISLSVDVSVHLYPSSRFLFRCTFLTIPPADVCFLILNYFSLVTTLCFLCLCTPTPSSLFPPRSDGFSPLFSFPFPPLLIPLSSSLQHSAQSIRCPLLSPSIHP